MNKHVQLVAILFFTLNVVAQQQQKQWSQMTPEEQKQSQMQGQLQFFSQNANAQHELQKLREQITALRTEMQNDPSTTYRFSAESHKATKEAEKYLISQGYPRAIFEDRAIWAARIQDVVYPILIQRRTNFMIDILLLEQQLTVAEIDLANAAANEYRARSNEKGEKSALSDIRDHVHRLRELQNQERYHRKSLSPTKDFSALLNKHQSQLGEYDPLLARLKGLEEKEEQTRKQMDDFMKRFGQINMDKWPNTGLIKMADPRQSNNSYDQSGQQANNQSGQAAGRPGQAQPMPTQQPTSQPPPQQPTPQPRQQQSFPEHGRPQTLTQQPPPQPQRGG
ncbi:MAG: hypothetical protein DI535_00750 [Citrobacter freundii]|nr:MAG: hypothetical protein DI535_00750 [Citrobacter freundii]